MTHGVVGPYLQNFEDFLPSIDHLALAMESIERDASTVFFALIFGYGKQRIETYIRESDSKSFPTLKAYLWHSKDGALKTTIIMPVPDACDTPDTFFTHPSAQIVFRSGDRMVQFFRDDDGALKLFEVVGDEAFSEELANLCPEKLNELSAFSKKMRDTIISDLN